MTVQMQVKRQQVTMLLNAAEIYADAEWAKGVWKGAEKEGICLSRGEVVENDAPGSGRSDQEGIEPFFGLSGQVVLSKVLHLDEVETEGAQLAFIAKERKEHQATLRFLVNGHEVLRKPSPQAAPEAKHYWELTVGEWGWSRWYYVDIPPEALVRGENVIEVSVVDGREGWQLMVADYRDFYKGMLDPVVLPHASKRSEDGGQNWKDERGEYVLRLALERYRSKGELRSPVLDGAGEDDAVVKSRCRVERLSLDWEAEVPKGTQLELALRSGSTPVWAEDHWSEWRVCTPGEKVSTSGRYLQFKVQFSTVNRCATPTLKSLQVAAETRDGEEGPRVVGAENARLLRSSYQMPWENYQTEMLVELRRRFELDAVVAGVQTEFELIQRLHRWAYHVPLGSCTHFPWKVLDWIALGRDESGAIKMNTYEQRRRDLMCLYPNVVLVAACLSFGIPARHLNFHSEGMTGHEIAEVWSNDYGKWIHLDATRDYYWYNPKTLVPLDTQEIHQVLVDRLDQAERWNSPYLFRQDLDELVRDLPISFYNGQYEYEVDEGAYFLFRSFCHFRIIPRFNPFSQERPLPVSQGTEVWSWDGYLNWADDKVPPLPHFSQHTNRRADFYPTLNQTRFTVESTDSAQRLWVYLETETPGFTNFEVCFDREEWRREASQFEWNLHPGLNILEVRSRNNAGVRGIISTLSLEV